MGPWERLFPRPARLLPPRHVVAPPHRRAVVRGHWAGHEHCGSGASVGGVSRRQPPPTCSRAALRRRRPLLALRQRPQSRPKRPRDLLPQQGRAGRGRRRCCEGARGGGVEASCAGLRVACWAWGAPPGVPRGPGGGLSRWAAAPRGRRGKASPPRRRSEVARAAASSLRRVAPATGRARRSIDRSWLARASPIAASAARLPGLRRTLAVAHARLSRSALRFGGACGSRELPSGW